MKNRLLVINMKMYMDIKDICKYIKEVNDFENLIICPEAMYIPFFLNHYKKIGIQNIIANDICTGGNSLSHAKKLGVSYAIIGHSETRSYLNITDSDVNKQIESCCDNNIIPIMCIGESLEDKNSGNTKKIIKKQIMDGLNGIKCDRIIIAYEPTYAIGSGLVPTSDEIISIVSYIKEILKDIKINASVLYGGSVNSKNIENLSKIDVLDGFMVGKSGTEVCEVLKMKKLLRS